MKSSATHLNNIFQDVFRQLTFLCIVFRRWMTYETWVGCMNHLRPSFDFHCSMTVPFLFLYVDTWSAPWETIFFLLSSFLFLFGLQRVLYDSFFRACWRWRTVCVQFPSCFSPWFHLLPDLRCDDLHFKQTWAPSPMENMAMFSFRMIRRRSLYSPKHSLGNFDHR